ncbi:hypothetical protein BABA_02954 [Neobacillus bataviensis LMG 21833]|uniref:Uncharacterized protein n=2 Tax=Neobacillus bataviensis TaxID=220685 RepID=K6DRE2_9BACI|nr:hypothetical protein BABA_02954 [Neobacillus bataviensis LMG 21833]
MVSGTILCYGRFWGEGEMKFLLKTQVVSLLMALFWIMYLALVAFLDQPGRALQYINLFVYGFAILFAVIYFLLTKYLLGRNWLAVPLVLVPYFLLYKPVFQRALVSIANESYGAIIKFLALSTGVTFLLATISGLCLAILFTRPHVKW